MFLSGQSMKRIAKIANTGTFKPLFAEIFLCEGRQPYFEPAIGYFEIREKIALRYSSDPDSIIILKKKYGQVTLKVGDLAIDELLLFSKITFRGA